jgi:hypothetical protein
MCRQRCTLQTGTRRLHLKNAKERMDMIAAHRDVGTASPRSGHRHLSRVEYEQAHYAALHPEPHPRPRRSSSRGERRRRTLSSPPSSLRISDTTLIVARLGMRSPRNPGRFTWPCAQDAGATARPNFTRSGSPLLSTGVCQGSVGLPLSGSGWCGVASRMRVREWLIRSVDVRGRSTRWILETPRSALPGPRHRLERRRRRAVCR